MLEFGFDMAGVEGLLIRFEGKNKMKRSCFQDLKELEKKSQDLT